MTDCDPVVVALANGVATVTLNRPAILNAINDRLADDLAAELERLAGAPDVRAVVLTGAGRGFCSGGDRSGLAIAGGGAADDAALAARTRHQMRAITLLREMPQVTIAAVNGACAGAGLGLALAADVRICSDTAVFRTAFLGAGLPSDYGVSWLLTRLVGAARARELLFFTDRFDARHAFAVGLVSAVVPADAFAAAAADLSRRMAALPPLAVAAMKANLADAERVGLGEVLDAEAARVARCQRSADAAEAIAAFAAGRPPQFAGR